MLRVSKVINVPDPTSSTGHAATPRPFSRRLPPQNCSTQTEEPEEEPEPRPKRPCAVRSKTSSTQASLDEELIARRWLKANGYYMAKHVDLAAHLWHHFMSVAKQPRGRADQAGSQQAAFSMEIPSKMAAARLLRGARSMGHTKYTVNAAGAIEWKKSPSIESYYFDQIKPMTSWLRLHTRGLNVHAYGSTKTVPPGGGYKEANVTVTIIPPLIMELCERSGGRLILEVTCNLMTLNDQGVHKLPPAFPYAEADAQSFLAAARHAIFEMKLKGVPLSSGLISLVRDEDMALSSDSCDET